MIIVAPKSLSDNPDSRVFLGVASVHCSLPLLAEHFFWCFVCWVISGCVLGIFNTILWDSGSFTAQGGCWHLCVLLIQKIQITFRLQVPTCLLHSVVLTSVQWHSRQPMCAPPHGHPETRAVVCLIAQLSQSKLAFQSQIHTCTARRQVRGLYTTLGAHFKVPPRHHVCNTFQAVDFHS